ncbi:MAG TPA: alkaline phosphatase family protein [Candidatus Thermoplasmatota archaeon]|nr:alkaline phosphatase family protein [Candidatus Thermoplasmatota archaeon]
MPSRRRLMILGLDGAVPDFVFEAYAKDLPNLTRLREQGLWGRLRSTHPPITVPAWSVMFTSKNPGKLGITGFRNLTRGTYDGQWIAFSDRVKEPRLWDLVGREGRDVIVHGVPQTYPPRPVRGCLTTCFLTPSRDRPWTWPLDLAEEIEAHLGRPYQFDVENYRREDKASLVEDIRAQSRLHYDTAEFLLSSKPWDLFIEVDMGTDRMHHGLWKLCDPQHRQFPGPNPLQHAILDYYKEADARVGRLLQLAGPDTIVLVVSDHGGKRMDGAINLNDWLVEEGYLVLKEPVTGTTPFDPSLVDWSRTKAWCLGGYYGRLFINKMGREPEGIVTEGEYEGLRSELIARISAIPDDQGRKLDTRVVRPEDVYTGPHVQDAPDLLVYFGDLHWRAHQGLGNASLWSHETEIGPDDATHDWDGVFILHDPARPGRGRELKGLDLRDVTPIALELLGLPIPNDLEGRSLSTLLTSVSP